MAKEKIKKLITFFTPYEYIWFCSLTLAGVLLAIFIPDGELSTTWLKTCSMIALVSGMMCELLIAKRCKWNFIVSLVFVEITEIIICLACGYYASAFVTLIFWIPVDTISFIAWYSHSDKMDKRLTEVKKLNYWQMLISILVIAVFSLLVGSLLQEVGGEDTYLDALTSAFGIANGLLILFRYREQWIAWYLYTIFEAILWILSGQWIMLVLSLGYLTNTTYGMITWTKNGKLVKARKRSVTKTIEINQNV